MKHYYQLLCCTIVLGLCAGQLFGQQGYLTFPGSGLQAYHPIKKWHGLVYRPFLAEAALFGGTSNTAYGLQALDDNTTGSYNSAFGAYAGVYNTTGGNNTAVGFFASEINTTGSNNSAVGIEALGLISGSGNTGMGAYAVGYLVGGNDLTAVGYNALGGGTGEGNSESYSVALGYDVLYNSISSTGANTGVGPWAMYSNTSGYYNSATGAASLYYNTTGYYNTANGSFALNASTTGYYNVGVGANALDNNTTGNDNTALGTNANTKTGTLSNSTVLGYGASVSANNTVVLGNTAVKAIGGIVGWTNFSDGRFKKNIQQNVPGLTFINKLTPITYTLDVDGIEAKLHENDKSPAIKDIPSMPSYQDDPVMKEAMKEKAAITYTGFVAQDVEKAAGSVGFDFSGVDKPEDVNQSFYGLRYGDFVVPLVKAVQELSASSDQKDSAINAVQNALQQKFDSLQTQVNELRALLLAKNASAMSGASLDQNSPNPFTGSTVIGYSLPKGTSSAKLQITDVNGNVLGIIPLSGSAGKSTVTASLSGHAAGNYMYSLIIDGKLVGTKQMTAMR